MAPPRTRLGSIEEHLGTQAVRSQVARPGQRSLVPAGIAAREPPKRPPITRARVSATGRPRGIARASPLWSSFAILRGDPRSTSRPASERLVLSFNNLGNCGRYLMRGSCGETSNTRFIRAPPQRLESFQSASANAPPYRGTGTGNAPVPPPLIYRSATRGANELFLDLIFVGAAFRAGMNIKHSHAFSCASVPPH